MVGVGELVCLPRALESDEGRLVDGWCYIWVDLFRSAQVGLPELLIRSVRCQFQQGVDGGAAAAAAAAAAASARLEQEKSMALHAPQRC